MVEKLNLGTYGGNPILDLLVPSMLFQNLCVREGSVGIRPRAQISPGPFPRLLGAAFLFSQARASAVHRIETEVDNMRRLNHATSQSGMAISLGTSFVLSWKWYVQSQLIRVGHLLLCPVIKPLFLSVS